MKLHLGSERVRKIAEAVRGAGGRALLVGGVVRDGARTGGTASGARDFDLEVYGLDATQLRAVLEGFGPVNAVGEALPNMLPSTIDGAMALTQMLCSANSWPRASLSAATAALLAV